MVVQKASDQLEVKVLMELLVLGRTSLIYLYNIQDDHQGMKYWRNMTHFIRDIRIIRFIYHSFYYYILLTLLLLFGGSSLPYCPWK